MQSYSSLKFNANAFTLIIDSDSRKEGNMSEAQILKEEALEQVSENSGEWMSHALAELKDGVKASLPWEFTGEDIRHWIVGRIGSPHHNNAFGPLISGAIRRGFISPTGKLASMKDPKSHGRQTMLYVAGSVN